VLNQQAKVRDAEMDVATETSSQSKYHVEIRDARGVVIGDNNVVYQYFLNERNAPLADKLITFSTLVEERSRSFVGRKFVLDQIDRFLLEQDRGYLVIVGEPGIGKTSLMSHLVTTRGWLHHFVVGAMGITLPEQFLENISAQLIARFGVNRKYIPPEAGRSGAYLAGLLEEVSAGLPPGERVVILVDALDEADPPVNNRGNVLFLPENLPKAVYFVVTRRPVPVPLVCPDTPPTVLFISPEETENWHDVRVYATAAVERDEVRNLLHAAGVSPQTFLEELLRRSRGNFMYLHHVLQSVRRGRLGPADLANLPDGLLNYYEHMWNRMQQREQSTWLAAYLPLLGVLVTAKSPLSAHALCNFLHMDIEGVLIIVKHLQEYLTLDQGRYQLYHASFRSFLSQQLPDQKKYQRMIVSRYTNSLGLIPPEALTQEEREYAFRFLADHLVEIGESDLLFAIVESEAWSDVIPTQDLVHAINLALSVAGSAKPPALAQIVSCILVRTTVAAQTANIPPAALRAMVLLGDTRRALGLASVMIEPAHRFEAYWEIVLALQTEDTSINLLRILDDATSVAHQINEAAYRSHSLAKVGALWAKYGEIGRASEILATAEQAARSVSDDYAGARARVLLEIVASYAGFAPASACAVLETMEGDWLLNSDAYVAVAVGMSVCCSVAETLAYCSSLLDGYNRSRSCFAVARSWAERGNYSNALVFAEKVDEPLARPALLVEIAKGFADEARIADAAALLQEVERLCNLTWQDNPAQVLADSAIVEARIQTNRDLFLAKVDRVLDLSQRISYQRRALCLAKLAVALTYFGEFEQGAALAVQAVETAMSGTELNLAIETLLEMAEILSDTQKSASLRALHETRSLLEQLTVRHLRAMKSARVARLLHKLNQITEANSILGQAVEDMQAIGTASWQATGVANLALNLIELRKIDWAKSLVEHAIKIGAETNTIDTQIEYIRRLGLEVQRLDVSTALMRPQMPEEHWHIRAHTNLAIAISRAGDATTALAVMKRTLLPLARQWIDADALQHAIEGLIYVLQPLHMQSSFLAQSTSLLDIAGDLIDRIRGREKAETTCRLYAKLAVTRVLCGDTDHLDALTSPVLSDLHKIRFEYVNTDFLVTIMRQIIYVAALSGNLIILKALEQHIERISEPEQQSQLMKQVELCRTLVRTAGVRKRDVERSIATMGEATRSSVEEVLNASDEQRALYPRDYGEAGKYPYRLPQYSFQEKKYSRLLRLQDRLSTAFTAKSPLSGFHLQEWLLGELTNILTLEERDQRAYELNVFFDETIKASTRLQMDVVGLAAVALQKAADMSRVDLWCALAAATPVIEKAGAATAIWRSMQATARWWDIRWYHEEHVHGLKDDNIDRFEKHDQRK